VGSGLLLEAELACAIPHQECEKHRFLYSISHQQITDFIPIDQSFALYYLNINQEHFKHMVRKHPSEGSPQE